MEAPSDVSELVDQLRQQQRRLRGLRAAMSANAPDDLAATIDEIGEHLLVADEELRVQAEQLSASTNSLQRVVQAYEELFADAPVGYVLTDGDGAIRRVNRAAARLAMLATWPGRPHTMVSLFRPEDRSPIRRAITRSRSHSRSADAATSEAVECALVRPDGTVLPVVVSVRPSYDGMTGDTSLHWELRPAVAVHAGAASGDPLARMRGGPPAGESDPQPRLGQAPIADDMAVAALDFAGQDTTEKLLLDVLERALVVFPTCDHVSISRLDKGGRLTAAATTLSASAGACDEFQSAIREGPTLTAITEHVIVRVASATTDLRWPRFAEGVTDLGVGSVLAIPLSPRGVNAALSVYATVEDAFDANDEFIGQAFATHAGIALAHAELEANLRTALQTRECIGQAVGILMERHRVTATQAFDLLVYVSQRTHRKLRDLAKWVVATGEDPHRLVKTSKRTESTAD